MTIVNTPRPCEASSRPGGNGHSAHIQAIEDWACAHVTIKKLTQGEPGFCR